MNIVEALKESKQNGGSYTRASASKGWKGWVKWDDDHLYHDLTAEDLVADDWIPTSEYVEKLTGGRWTVI